jgi:hypothetical protein
LAAFLREKSAFERQKPTANFQFEHTSSSKVLKPPLENFVMKHFS